MSTSRFKALLVTPTFSVAGDIGRRLNIQDYAFDVLHVPSLSAALKRCGSELFDVVFLSLSVLDQGFHGMRQLQDLLPDAPVLIVASRADQSEALRTIQQGADDCVLIDVPSQSIRQNAMNAIQRKRFLKEICATSCEDSATSLFSFGGFESVAQRLFSSCRKSPSKVYVLLFRVQGATGSTLTSIAKALRVACDQWQKSSSAGVARVSPEEFAILAPANSLAEARGLFHGAEDSLTTLMDKEHGAWSVAFGMAAYDPEFPSSAESVLERARRDVKPNHPIHSALSGPQPDTIQAGLPN